MVVRAAAVARMSEYHSGRGRELDPPLFGHRTYLISHRARRSGRFVHGPIYVGDIVKAS